MYFSILLLEITFTVLGYNGFTRFDIFFILDNVAHFELGVESSVIRIHAYPPSLGKAIFRPNFKAGRVNV